MDLSGKQKRMNKLASLMGIGLSLAVVSGCKREQVVEFEPNMVYAKSIEIDSGYSMKPALQETEVAVAEFFGTPDAPHIPPFLEEDDEYATLVSMDNLQKAAGAPTQAGQGLYQQHCATCHGITGNGRGETAALLDPYPRDYRMGKFKFKSTTRGAKPLKEDLAYSIKYGIQGTSMKVIKDLTDEDIEALVDYVIYLSWRGEFERNMLMEGGEIDFEGDEHLYDATSAEFEDQQELAQDFAIDIADSWLEAEDRVKEVPAPQGIPVPEAAAEVLAAANADDDSALKQSIAKGKEIFASEVAACAKCHGKEGYGDGQTQDYDDWTKEWTIRIGIDPTDEAAQVPLIARGALPPRKIVPRDFREGLYRGGSEPEQIYRRIAAGIDGTPMPAATLPPNDIWHLVNYVRSLGAPPSEQPGDEMIADVSPATTGGTQSPASE